ncbi:uncharacterized protein PGTG_15377 [Puccinia graminis f. sp. tritici CRL 75-36-700-3]|uniref:Uncharacterized protein n=1 Tax=Puccinia graminis f. sp. tritici (strain CRL 75-36-700-3 / race SCCL) TaxID=418459 RepID=E3KZJ6_PUCGT|nr:uncharacterized protein PGTG_15377 [Puccinia graminis f. sp. tritici CRL 75-36-700-3]EFP89721.2 hypothetical protein PGTG_15377 [Puccinia graminis f. sp. tritici CRL 75-36-700-3]
MINFGPSDLLDIRKGKLAAVAAFVSYPASPPRRKRGVLSWVNKRSKIILEQLERLRTSLSAKSPAKQDFYLAQAEKEIPLAGISRFTFDWNVPRDEDSAWNSVVIEVMGKKSVEWLRRTMKISEEEEAQAAAIIKRWLQTKSREIQQYGEMDITEYNKIKSKKSTKALYMRWRKKIKEERCRVADQIFKGIPQLAVVLEDKDCHSDIEDAQEGVNPVRVFPGYRSIHLTNILHNLDRMVQAQTTHHKKIETNKKMYARSASNHAPTVGGAIGVARDWPIDCYDETFWKCSANLSVTLSQKYRQSTFNSLRKPWPKCAVGALAAVRVVNRTKE